MNYSTRRESVEFQPRQNTAHQSNFQKREKFWNLSEKKKKKKKKKVENTHTNTGRKRTMDFSPFVRKRDVLDNALFPPLVDDLEDIFFN